MEGFVKIEASTYKGREGLSVESHLEHVGRLDRIQLVHALCTSLKIEADELRLLAAMMSSGVMSEIAEVETIYNDSDELPRVFGIDGGRDGGAMMKLLLELLS